MLGGLIILFVGFKLSQWAAKAVRNICEKRHLDITLTKFLAGIVQGVVFIFAALMAVEKFGVTRSSGNPFESSFLLPPSLFVIPDRIRRRRKSGIP